MSDDTSTDLEPSRFTLDYSTIAEQLLAPGDDSAINETAKRRAFIERVARGFGTTHAGLAVGWSPAQIKRVVGEPEMAEILLAVEEYQNDTVEYAILRNAQAGNSQAQKMWALAKMPERGWVEKKTHVIEGQARVDVVHSVKEALKDMIHGEDDIAALHRQHAIPAEVVDAS